MKNINRLLIVGALSLVAVLPSCKKSFLDVEPSEYLSEKQKNAEEKDPTVLDKSLDAQTKAVYQALYDSPVDAHDGFGLKAIQFATDLICEDITFNQMAWFIYDYQNVNFEANYRRTKVVWKVFYNTIATSNRILDKYIGDKEVKDPVLLKKQATLLGLRGMAYFHLVNAYQLTYKGNEDKLGVPLVLKSSDKKLPRATVDEVYKQIVKDLTFSVENGDVTDVRTDFDRNVAAAYLSKVYAQMEDWANVEKYAQIAKTGGTDIITMPRRSWELTASPDVLFGFSVNDTNTGIYASFYSHTDLYQRGYAGGLNGKKLIYDNLYAQIPETDSRKMLFINPDLFKKDKTDEEVAKLKLYQALYDEVESKIVVPLEAYDQLKYANTSTGFTGDYSFLRVQDPILLEIEAKVELNKLAEAESLLNEFVQKRNPKFVASKTQEDLRKEVRLQRRLELWMEGTNFFDFKRWKEDCVRLKGSNHIAMVGETYNLGDKALKYVYKLPQGEIDSNPKLVQN